MPHGHHHHTHSEVKNLVAKRVPHMRHKHDALATAALTIMADPKFAIFAGEDNPMGAVKIAVARDLRRA